MQNDQPIKKHKIMLTAQFPVDLVTFTEEIFNGKLHFLYSVSFKEGSFLILVNTSKTIRNLVVSSSLIHLSEEDKALNLGWCSYQNALRKKCL